MVVEMRDMYCSAVSKAIWKRNWRSHTISRPTSAAYLGTFFDRLQALDV